MPEVGCLKAINRVLHGEMERDKNVFMAGIDRTG
jgi:pyruvate/2-oxoglutarate/acetoin dehydrogenase E1 component